MGDSTLAPDKHGLSRRNDVCRQPRPADDRARKHRRRGPTSGKLPLNMKLADKVAIITGGAHGIGRAIASAFSEQGAAVLIADIDVEAGEDAAADIRKLGQAASFAHVDVTDEAQAARAVQMAAAKNGRIDILVNNAAWLPVWHDIENAPHSEWD